MRINFNSPLYDWVMTTGIMRKDILEAFHKMDKAHDKYEALCGILESKVIEVCDFNAGVTHCAGDGHLVINVDSYQVATMNCLIGKSKTNKLTKSDHLGFCI